MKNQISPVTGKNASLKKLLTLNNKSSLNNCVEKYSCCLKYGFTCLLCLNFFNSIHAQQTNDVILQGFYLGPYWNDSAWNTKNTWGVPCPADSLSFPQASQWFYDILSSKANTIAASGFTAVWLPPMSKGCLGSYGSYKNPKYLSGGIYDPGYGIFDDYDLGDKLQQNSTQTRYGSREQLMRCIATMHANGLNVYEDIVTNQRNGANLNPVAPGYQWFQYKDAFGNDSGGRFPKYTKDFHNPPRGKPGAPGGNEDPDVPVTTFPNGKLTGDKEGFWGPDFAHITGEKNINGDTGVWCATELKNWGDWLVKSAGVQGYRLDAVSGISWDWLKTFVTYGAMSNKFSVTELAGARYSVPDLKLWMQQSMGQSGSNFTMFDQVLQGALNALCKTNKFWMGAMLSKHLAWGATNEINAGAGTEDPGSLDIYRSLMVTAPAQSVTVVNEVDAESPVFGNPPGAVLPKQCLPGYAYITTIGYGIPCISFKDWCTDAGCYGATMIDSNNLNYHLNKLIWCHKFVCTGKLSNEQVSKNGYVYAFQRGSNAMVFINSNQLANVTIDAATTIPNGTVLIDYTDHNITATVSSGKISVSVPANKNGRGYLVMAPQNIIGNFLITAKATTQECDANADISIPPASNTNRQVCRIWVDKNQAIATAVLAYNTTNWNANTNLKLEICKSSDDNTINISVASRKFTSTQQNQSLNYTTSTNGAGFYSIWVKGNNLPSTGGYWWFNLQNTYTAPQVISMDFNQAPVLISATDSNKKIELNKTGVSKLK